MILIIDCFKLVKGVGKSIGIYNLTKSLVEYLGEENVRKNHEQKIIVLGNKYNRQDMENDGVTFKELKGNPLDKKYILWWELFGVTGEVKKYNPDRVLFPRGFAPLWYKGKDTIIIHDLIPFYYKENFPQSINKLENFYITNRLASSIKHADRVITISDYSRQDINNRVPGSENKITEICNGLNDIELSVDFKVSDEDYIVAVTSMLPHKNAKGIIKAYEAYYKKSDKPFELKIIGIESIDSLGMKEAISEDISKHITCYKFIKEYSDMCKMIKGARFFLFMSYIEGFGFPPLEAMQLGCPVISSNRTSLGEVLGDAGIGVDPDDIDCVSDKMLLLEKNPKIGEDLAQKGYQNIKKYGWDTRTKLYWDELFR